METQSPFSFLSQLKLPKLPDSMMAEMQNRLVLLINHVLQQEPEAMARLKRQQGRTLQVQWLQFSFSLETTPAGLLSVTTLTGEPDLSLTVMETSPLRILHKTLIGEKPEVRIAGDVQLAAEVNWLVDHVRWDVEEDLSRILGDVPAHHICRLTGTIVSSLRSFAAPKTV